MKTTSNFESTGSTSMIFTVPPGIDPPKIPDRKKPGCLCECHTPGTLSEILSWPCPLDMKCAECTCRGL